MDSHQLASKKGNDGVKIGEWVRHLTKSGKYYFYNVKSYAVQLEKPREWLEYEERHEPAPSQSSSFTSNTPSSSLSSLHRQQNQSHQPSSWSSNISRDTLRSNTVSSEEAAKYLQQHDSSLSPQISDLHLPDSQVPSPKHQLDNSNLGHGLCDLGQQQSEDLNSEVMDISVSPLKISDSDAPTSTKETASTSNHHGDFGAGYEESCQGTPRRTRSSESSPIKIGISKVKPYETIEVLCEKDQEVEEDDDGTENYEFTELIPCNLNSDAESTHSDPSEPTLSTSHCPSPLRLSTPPSTLSPPQKQQQKPKPRKRWRDSSTPSPILTQSASRKKLRLYDVVLGTVPAPKNVENSIGTTTTTINAMEVAEDEDCNVVLVDVTSLPSSSSSSSSTPNGSVDDTIAPSTETATTKSSGSNRFEDDQEDSSSVCSTLSASSIELKKIGSKADLNSSNITNQTLTNGRSTPSGYWKSLLNIEDPPIIMPSKTNYLSAGLLSNSFKGERGMMVPPPTHNLLPLPLYCKRTLLTNRKEFVLPYDIWCFGVINTRNVHEQVEEQLRQQKAAEKKAQRRKKRMTASLSNTNHKTTKVPMSDVIPDSWNYQRIRTNSYFEKSNAKAKQTFDMENDQLCPCSNVENKCSTEACINRVTYNECPPLCGDNCKNRRIQKFEHTKDVERFLTPNKGYGVKTTQPIKAGEFILEYVGEVVPDAVFKERMNGIYKDDQHHYGLQLGGGMVIDGHRMGGECRFVNHSCEPNCEMQKWSVNGLSRIALFALRDLEKDEELSYDNDLWLFNPAEGQACHCGSQICREVFGGRTKEANKVDPLKVKSTIKRLGQSKMISRATINPAIFEKMKPLYESDKLFVQDHNVFLVRNYEKVRLGRGGKETAVNERFEKMMTSRVTRFKVGSTKNKPLIVDESLLKYLHSLVPTFNDDPADLLGLLKQNERR